MYTDICKEIVSELTEFNGRSLFYIDKLKELVGLYFVHLTTLNSPRSIRGIIRIRELHTFSLFPPLDPDQNWSVKKRHGELGVFVTRKPRSIGSIVFLHQEVILDTSDKFRSMPQPL